MKDKIEKILEKKLTSVNFKSIVLNVADEETIFLSQQLTSAK